jgi:hypothetical protein
MSQYRLSGRALLARIAPNRRDNRPVSNLTILAGSAAIEVMPPDPRRYILHEDCVVLCGRVAAAMKLATLLARVTICSAVIGGAGAGLAARADWPTWQARPASLARAPGCTRPLFTPEVPAPHFVMPQAGPWREYRGATVEHDWPEARRWLAGPRPPSFRPLRSLLAWLESVLMPHSHGRVVCRYCPPAPIGFELGYDELPVVEDFPRAEQPGPPPLPMPDLPPLLDPDPIRSVPEPSGPAATSNPPVLIAPPVEPSVPETTPERRTPSQPPVVELAPDPVLPPDPAPTLPPRNRVPKPGVLPPRNQIPR